MHAVNKVKEGRPHIVDMIKNGEIQLVFTTVDETRTRDRRLAAHPPGRARHARHLLHEHGRREAAVEGMKHRDELGVLAAGIARRTALSDARLQCQAPPPPSSGGGFALWTRIRHDHRFRSPDAAPRSCARSCSRLKTVERHAVIQAIAEARAHGDLSENAEYEAAKDQQGFIEGRIAESRASSRPRRSSTRRTIDADGRVVFGSTVDLEDDGQRRQR